MLCLWLLTFLNISFCLASIQFNCTAGESKTVVYQCTVDQGFVLGWRIVINETVTCQGKEYTEGYQVNNPTQVPCAPDFTTTLLSNTSPLISTISFTLNTNLTGYIIGCYDVSGNTTECKILGTPTAPVSFMCTNITNDSLTLQWGEPTDNGGEEELQYNITGTPGDISIVENGNSRPVEGLEPNNTYSFRIQASNSLGFGSETSIECTTEGNRPPLFDNVKACLDSDGDSELIVIYTPCPLMVDEDTPEEITYRVVLNASEFSPMYSDSCDFSTVINQGVYSVDVYANNSVGSTRTSGPVFDASWIRDVSVTDVISSSAVIQYTTADCVLSSDLIVELITPNYSMVDGGTTHDYRNGTTSNFSFTSLIEGDMVSFTLQVTVSSTTVYSTTGSFTALPSPVTDPTDPTDSTDPTDNTTDATDGGSEEGSMLPLIGGVVGAVVAVVAVIVIILAIIACYMYCKKSNNNKTSVDLLGVKGGSSGDPIPLRESRGPLPETGQGQYQDPTTIERQQAPTGDLYALPDKPRRQPPPPGPSSATEAATYQDPNTIERQQAPTGDTYALPQKKPQYSKVDKANKGSPAMYAELGFEDGSQPPISPSSQPLTPKDKAQVMYADVRGQ